MNSTATRERIAVAIAANPGSSLRAIAAKAGASPETVRTVRAAMQRREMPNVTNTRTVNPQTTSSNGAGSLLTPKRGSTIEQWAPDTALTSTPAGNLFVKWFERTIVSDDWREHVSSVPLSRVYEIADQARRRATQWTSFADALESRISEKRARHA